PRRPHSRALQKPTPTTRNAAAKRTSSKGVGVCAPGISTELGGAATPMRAPILIATKISATHLRVALAFLRNTALERPSQKTPSTTPAHFIGTERSDVERNGPEIRAKPRNAKINESRAGRTRRVSRGGTRRGGTSAKSSARSCIVVSVS